MKIVKLKAKNFRLLKNLELDLENELSLVIGKNNCGKTSLLSLLDKFLVTRPSQNSFQFNDFNLDLQNEISTRILSGSYTRDLNISLKLYIQYEGSDSLKNIHKLILDLNPANNILLLSFEYKIDEPEFDKFHNAAVTYVNSKATEESTEEDKTQILNSFIKGNFHRFFRLSRKSISYNVAESEEVENKFIDIDKERIPITDIINYKLISAKRDVSNKDSDKTLSFLASKYYEKQEEAESVSSKEIEEFKEALSETDKKLDIIYKGIFGQVIERVRVFGGIREGDSVININSTLEHRNLLQGNTTVMYKHDGHSSLPENYNGLGYLNLISMIFEIEVKLHEFRRKIREEENPADINLLFIEEPEAHTHPQMQYVFIKNIKDILKKSSEENRLNLQSIITTHSSHITAESNFDDIKYFKREGNEVVAKNLKDLEKEYGEEEGQHFKFLTQYLTLNKAELFFADKAIFIEGDTERILLPAMMKKIDQETSDDQTPLLSQNISIVEVGAHSQIFEKFIEFIGVKSLIITDLDSATTDRSASRVSDGSITTNASLNFFYHTNQLTTLTGKTFENKILKKDTEEDKWKEDDKGSVAVCYQTTEDGYNARSFEDSFFNVNLGFIKDHRDDFNSLKNTSFLDDEDKDAYDLAENCIQKKPAFAVEILINSETDDQGLHFANWEVPTYIKEGLEWLK